MAEFVGFRLLGAPLSVTHRALWIPRHFPFGPIPSGKASWLDERGKCRAGQPKVEKERRGKEQVTSHVDGYRSQ